MKIDFYHEIVEDPEPEDAGTIRVTARIFGEYDNLIFTTLSFAQDFIENEECQSKQDLNYFLMESEINDDYIADAMINLIVHVDEVTCSASSEYSPGCALEVWMDLLPDYLDDDSQIEEAVLVSFDETNNNIPFRPASKLVVKSLTRKIYKKIISSSGEKCTICLEEFNDGESMVTLPCGHDFDDECIVKWFETSHVCPLCRFELPCEDQ